MQQPQYHQPRLSLWADRLRLIDKVSIPKGIPAIYAVVNLINQRMYIGRTRCARKRAKEHLSHLKNGTHHVVDLQVDFRRFGPQWFEFRVLEIVSDPADLEAREDEWILRHSKAQLYNAPAEYDRAGRRRRRRISRYVQGSLFEFADDVAP
ncbi:GIY-YIG nuclease family protein [Staphylospora marina]|uniref:GIY-YIG nuclease family protein n=1 Tax=Staphylospora marina TaxID=2490858 RepID=UPI000F5BCA10|nr:GIY-YIG nuclease family protein [Staphylospora marina]